MATKKPAPKKKPAAPKANKDKAALYAIGAIVNGPGSAMEKIEAVHQVISAAV